MILALLILLAPAPTAAPVRQSTDSIAEIRAIRDRYNRAIGSHDMAAIRALLEPDYVVLPGSSGVALDAGQLSARLFADRTLITYVRKPRTITISRSGKRAAETGSMDGTLAQAGRSDAADRHLPGDVGAQRRNLAAEE